MANEESKELSLHRERIPLADKETQRKAAQDRDKQIKTDMAQVFGTSEGRRVLTYIYNLCGYGETTVGGNPQLGMDIKDGTLYNSARRSIYVELRKWIPAKILKSAEFNDLEKMEIT